jgi:hypothetical protein
MCVDAYFEQLSAYIQDVSILNLDKPSASILYLIQTLRRAWVDTTSFYSFPCTWDDHRHVVAYDHFQCTTKSSVFVSKGFFDSAVWKSLTYRSLCQTGWTFSPHCFLLSCRLYLSKLFLVNEFPAIVVWDLNIVERFFYAAFYNSFFSSSVPLFQSSLCWICNIAK